jgi:hypothetical protein
MQNASFLLNKLLLTKEVYRIIQHAGLGQAHKSSNSHTHGTKLCPQGRVLEKVGFAVALTGTLFIKSERTVPYSREFS